MILNPEFISIVCVSVLFIIFVFLFFRDYKIKKLVYSDTILFIKTNPKRYTIINGSKKIIKERYPFYDATFWTDTEQDIMLSGKSQILMIRDNEKLYKVYMEKVSYYTDGLLVRIDGFEDTSIMKWIDILNASPFYFFVLDKDANIIYGNSSTNLLGITNLRDVCKDKEVLDAIFKSKENITHPIQLCFKSNPPACFWYCASFYPQYEYGVNEHYWFVLGTDITEEVGLKTQVEVKTNIIDILQTGVMSLFMDTRFSNNISKILVSLGSTLGVQRAYIYKVEDGKLTLRHEWNEIHVSKTMEEELYANLESVRSVLKLNEIKPTVIDETMISDDRKNVWHKYKLANRILIPLVARNGELWGIFGFDKYYERKKFADEHLQLISLMGVIINAIVVLETDEQEIKMLNNQVITILNALKKQLNTEIEHTKTINELIKNDISNGG